ncbi:MAG: hypothetical protein ACHBNF_04670 [Chromatiales bacterium]
MDRRFLDFEDTEDPEGGAYKSYLARLDFGDGGYDWPKLLQSRYVVVLGEPGTGKTIELRERANILQQQKHYAFFIRLDQLVSGPLDDALEAGDVSPFQRWHRSRDEATFFLDSVDEAKLIKPEAFSDALNHFARDLGRDGLKRARLVISCRVSDWRGKADRYELRRVFSIPDENPRSDETDSGDQPPALRIVALAPLDEERIGKYAAHLGISEPQAFLHAIDESHAWDLTGRPADVGGLIKYWIKNGRLGTWKELCENDVIEKLAESEPRQSRDPLTPERARLGAETSRQPSYLHAASICWFLIRATI